jgi:threonine synthase
VPPAVVFIYLPQTLGTHNSQLFRQTDRCRFKVEKQRGTQVDDMSYRAWFECIRCASRRYPLDQVIYECECGGLMEVRHDMDALCRRSGSEWRSLFDQRYMRTNWPYGSGVWGKKEMVCPAVADDNVVSMQEGGSNLFWAERLGKELGVEELWIKQCGNSHTGSFKDLGMTVLVSMVHQMRCDGQDIPAIVCASTGDTSAALAAYGAAANIPVIVLLPKDKISVSQLVQPIANGALTLSIRTDFDGCMRLVRELVQKENVYLANSMNSLRIEGQKTVAIEMVQQDDWKVPDWVIIPGGNLGNVTALGKGFLEMQQMGMIDRVPNIAVAQSANANPFYRSFQKGFEPFEAIAASDTLASAIRIGNPVSWERAIRVMRQFDGVVEEATEDELADACARADQTGLFTCPHTGVALAALEKLLARRVIAPDSRVVVVSTAHGLKFPDFKVKYHEDELRDFEVSPTRANHPLEIDPDFDQVRRAILDASEPITATAN